MRKEQTAPPHPGRGCAAGLFKKAVGAAGLFKKAVCGGAVSEAAFLAVGGIPLWDGRVAFVENG